MFLTAHIDSQGFIFTHNDFKWNELGLNSYLKTEAIVSAGRSNISSARNYVNYFGLIKMTYNSMRNELIGFLTGWATMSTDNKKACVENFIYPVTETIANLNLLYTQAERDDFKKATMKILNEESDNLFSVIKDDTDGKYYKLTTTAGTLVSTEIKTDNIL